MGIKGLKWKNKEKEVKLEELLEKIAKLGMNNEEVTEEEVKEIIELSKEVLKKIKFNIRMNNKGIKIRIKGL